MTVFDGLAGPYGTIVADPPWSYQRSGVQGAADDEYSTLTGDDIAALPVEQLAADDAHLYMHRHRPQRRLPAPGRFVVDVRDGLWLDNDMTTEQITWAKVGQFTWTADHYGNDVEVWLDDNGYWGWRVMWNGGSDRGWADTMEDAKAEATR